MPRYLHYFIDFYSNASTKRLLLLLIFSIDMLSKRIESFSAMWKWKSETRACELILITEMNCTPILFWNSEPEFIRGLVKWSEWEISTKNSRQYLCKAG